MVGKKETEWGSNPLRSAQTRSRSMLRQNGGPAATINLFLTDELFKSIMKPEILDIILPKTNRKGTRVYDAFSNDLLDRFPLASGWPPSKTFQSFVETELFIFIGILIAACLHRKNTENLNDKWRDGTLSFVRTAVLRDHDFDNNA